MCCVAFFDFKKEKEKEKNEIKKEKKKKGEKIISSTGKEEEKREEKRREGADEVRNPEQTDGQSLLPLKSKKQQKGFVFSNKKFWYHATITSDATWLDNWKQEERGNRHLKAFWDRIEIRFTLQKASQCRLGHTIFEQKKEFWYLSGTKTDAHFPEGETWELTEYHI